MRGEIPVIGSPAYTDTQPGYLFGGEMNQD